LQTYPKQVSHSLFRSLKVEGTSIFVANGVAAGQRAPHFMLHIIPRAKDDGISIDWTPKSIDENTAKEIFNKLAASVSKQFNVEVPKLAESTEAPKAPPKTPEPEKKQDQEKKVVKSKLDEITDFLTGGKK